MTLRYLLWIYIALITNSSRNSSNRMFIGKIEQKKKITVVVKIIFQGRCGHMKHIIDTEVSLTALSMAYSFTTGHSRSKYDVFLSSEATKGSYSSGNKGHLSCHKADMGKGQCTACFQKRQLPTHYISVVQVVRTENQWQK